MFIRFLLQFRREGRENKIQTEKAISAHACIYNCKISNSYTDVPGIQLCVLMDPMINLAQGQFLIKLIIVLRIISSGATKFNKEPLNAPK